MLDQLPIEVLDIVAKLGKLKPNDQGQLAQVNRSLRATRKTTDVAKEIYNKFKPQNLDKTYDQAIEIVGFNNLWKILINLPEKADVLSAALSDNAKAYYKEHKIAQADFIKHGRKIIHFVTYYLKPHIVKLINNGINFDDIAAIDIKNIYNLENLSSNSVIKCVKQEYFTLKYLAALDIIKIPPLISNDAIECYEKGYFTPELIATFTKTIIEALTSDNVIKCYEKGYFKPQDLLKICSIDKVKALTSDNTIKCYEAQYFQPHQLLGINEFITFKKHNIKYSQEDLGYVSALKIKRLTSDNAIECYEKNYFTPKDLISLELGIIACLISDNAIICYRENYISPEKIFELDKDIIFKIFQNNAMIYYKEFNISPYQLIDLKEKLEYFLDYDYVPHIKKLLKAGLKFEKIAEIIAIEDFEKLQHIASDNAIKCYRKGYITPEKVIEFGGDTIPKIFQDIMHEYNGGMDIKSALEVHDQDHHNEDVELLG